MKVENKNQRNEELKELLSFKPKKPARKIDYTIEKETIKLLYDTLVYPVVKEAFEDLEDRIDDLFFLAYSKFEKNHGIPESELMMIEEKIRAKVEGFKKKTEAKIQAGKAKGL